MERARINGVEIAYELRGAGVPVLMELYARMKDTPENVNLDELWQQLGVEVREGKVVIHDDAPLAATREAITRSVQEKVQDSR